MNKQKDPNFKLTAIAKPRIRPSSTPKGLHVFRVAQAGRLLYRRLVTYEGGGDSLPTASRRYSTARQSRNRHGARLCRRPAAAASISIWHSSYFQAAAAGLRHSRAPVAEF